MKLASGAGWIVVVTGCLLGCSGADIPIAGESAGLPTGPTTLSWRRPGSPAAGHQPGPIVLVHGLDGFKNIGAIDYFYGVADALRKDGHQVLVPQLASYNSSEVRGAQLEAFVDNALLETGAARVNLICHSLGGLDCRYVASHLGAQIASVTTIAAPHHGTPIANIVAGDLPGPVQDAVDEFLNLIGDVVDQGTMSQDAKAALAQMTTKGAEAFNQRYPDHPQVAYYSIAGRSNGSRGDDACGSSFEPPFISKYDQATDGVGVELAPSAAIIDRSFNPTPTNDGLVPASSARWGTFLGCLPSDHLGEMCHIKNGDAGASYDCVQLYRDLAAWLVARGY
jgi:triacylglycerol lipase